MSWHKGFRNSKKNRQKGVQNFASQKLNNLIMFYVTECAK